MKKVSVFLGFIVVIVLCFSLTSCQEDVPMVYPTDAPTLEGVSVEYISADLEAETPTIKVKWINNSEFSINFGRSATIQKEIDGNWESLGALSSQQGMQKVEAGQTIEIDYKITCQGVSSPGKFKIEAIFNVMDEASLEAYPASVEFEL